MNFKQDSFVQVVAPNGDYRYGYVKATDEDGWHLTICMHEEAESKLAFEGSPDHWDGQASIAKQYGLAAKEIRVLKALSQDPKTSSIAKQLNISPGTVRTHIRVLRLKLRVDNRAQLVNVAQAIMKSVEAREDK